MSLKHALINHCAIPNNDKQHCGRPLYSANEHDPFPVCLMHSRDPQKSRSEFRKEFTRIVEEAIRDDSIADFTYFIFPEGEYGGREFAVECSFTLAEFCGEKTSFREATFSKQVTFTAAKFRSKVDFSKA